MNSLLNTLPEPLRVVAFGVAVAVALVSFVAVSALVFIYLERKIAGRIQDRLGPTRVGPFGLLQTLADGIKLLTKEDTTPALADRFLFRLAPYLAFCASFTAFLVLPFGETVVGYDLSIGLFFILAILSSEVFGVLLAGYGSGSKWSLFGGIREAAQVVSYEIPRSLTVLVSVCLAGTLNLSQLALAQRGFAWNWYLFHDPFSFLAFFVFFVCVVASCKRAPFDLAESESELVAGFHTEYSGLRWSFFFMAEYGSMFAVSGLASLLFLGGWQSGVVPLSLGERFGIAGTLADIAVFIGKACMLVVVMMWVRWSMPRLRIDQVMTTCLKYLLPISCVLLVGVCAWQLVVPLAVRSLFPKVLFSICLFAFVFGTVRLFTRTLSTPRDGLAGVWRQHG